MSPYFLSFLINFYSAMYRSKCLRSLISLELIPRLLVILIPRILLLMMNIIMPTIINAASVVKEKRILNTTNSTIKG